MKRTGRTEVTKLNLANAWKLKKEFPHAIKSITHIGQEMNITIYDDVKNISTLVKTLNKMKLKMYCIKKINGEILADERGMKCSK